MAAIAVDGNLISLALGIFHHRLDRRRLVVIRADVHALYAETLLVAEELHLREIHLLLSGRFSDGPLKIFLRDEIREPDHRNETESVFIGIIYLTILSPPQAFERRDDILEEALDPIIALVTHLQRVCYAVELLQSLFIGSTFFVGITFAADCQEVHDGHSHYGRRGCREVELLKLLFEIKCYSCRDKSQGLTNQQDAKRATIPTANNAHWTGLCLPKKTAQTRKMKV